MRLHILPDEKIIDRTIDIFEHVYPKDNKYIILLSNDKCMHVKVQQDNVVAVEYGSDSFWKEVGCVEAYESIIIHYLSYSAADFVCKIKHNNIYWIEWGGDLYNNLLYHRGYKLYSNPLLIYYYLYGNVFKACAHLLLRKFSTNKTILDAISRIKFFVPDSMYDEYPLFLHYYPQFSHLQYKNFFYYPIDQVISEKLHNKRCCGLNIIVGNSCSFSGNHFEIIKILSKYKVFNRKIIFPISYAGNMRYRKKLLSYGKKMLGNSFSPITDFMSLDDYNGTILSASIFIYNNYRQEAVGNILVALYFGGKVFLSENNPLLYFYKSKGIIIFSISQINEEMLSSNLDEQSQNKNREIITNTYSTEQLYDLVRHNF